jgi:Cytochrome c552/Cytochrome c554 and c-prime
MARRAAAAPRGSSRVSKAWWIGALLVATAVLGDAMLRPREPHSASYQTAGRPVQIAEEGYVSSAACRACHPREYESWHTSFHRSMTQVATPETVQADFDGTRVAEVQGQPMLLQRRGDEFWAEFDDPDTSRPGQPPSRIARQVVMVTGSHHQQVYWYRTEHGRVVGQIPGTYIIAERRWMPRAMVFLRPPVTHPPSATGNWNVMCINCHVTHGKGKVALPTTRTADSSVAEFGIACEACHGPGDYHVRVNQNPVRRYWAHLTGLHDSTTVQPATLEPKAASQVCGQCHGVFSYAGRADELSVNAAGHRYRPGQNLLDTRFLVRPSAKEESAKQREFATNNKAFMAGTFWSDGMVRVSGREYNGLIESPCYLGAKNATDTLSCFSCHSMHKESGDGRSTREWAETHQVSPGMDTNQACLACHKQLVGNLTAHTKHAEGSSGSSCYNCHMPYTSYGLLKALRSHQISSPSVNASVATGRPNACNACHLDKTLGWTATYLDRWYGTKTDALSDDDRNIAASLLWSIKGDAGQRALMAWAMGWRTAQEASGTDWMPAHLSAMLDDPYDAVRFITYRSMRSLPGFTTFSGDFLASPAQRGSDIARILGQWQSSWKGGSRKALGEVLLNTDGSLQLATIQRLLAERDNRIVALAE